MLKHQAGVGISTLGRNLLEVKVSLQICRFRLLRKKEAAGVITEFAHSGVQEQGIFFKPTKIAFFKIYDRLAVGVVEIVSKHLGVEL